MLSCEGVNSIDLAGLETLHEIHDMLEERGASLVAPEIKGPVRDLIARDLRSPPVLPWHHKIGGADDAAHPPFPLSVMVASVDDALALLRKAGPALVTPAAGAATEAMLAQL